MRNQPDPQQRFLYYLIGFVVLLFLIRMPFLWRILLMVVPAGLLAWLSIRWYEWRKECQAKVAYENSVEGSLNRRIDYCRNEIHRNKREIREIEESIEPLEEKLHSAVALPETTRAETNHLIEAFQAEKQLRLSKIHFFENAIEKLKSMLDHHQLSSMLAEKQQKLRTLREKDHDDLADLEAFRSDIEYDRTYLQTLDELSNRLLDSHSTSHVEALMNELESMTASIAQKKSSR
ncbi:MAG: hypothetical protein KDC44_23350 [Phaeodactylibacter sp.]|nr:hypothetical protein [Phaeodactylibacter sp.]